MLSNNKKIAEIGSKVGNLEHIVKVLKDEMFALEGKILEQDKQISKQEKKISELTEKLQEKQDIIDEQEKEIRRWNDGIANIMNYSLEVARGDKK